MKPAIKAAPLPVTLSIPTERLSASLGAAILFTCGDFTRPHLNGVALAVEGGNLAFVSTNGNALARVVPIDAKGATGPDRVLAIIPLADAKSIAKLAKDAKKNLAPAELEVAGDRVTYRHDGRTVEIKALDFTFPAYAQIIPDKRPAGAGDAASLIGLSPGLVGDACKAISLFAPRAGRQDGMTVSITGPLDPVRVDCSDPDAGDLTIVIMPMRLPK